MPEIDDQLLGTAVRVSGQGIAILTPAIEAIGPRIHFVNDAFCSMYGSRWKNRVPEVVPP